MSSNKTKLIMLPTKSTTIVSEVKDFFTSSEKAINTVLNRPTNCIQSYGQLKFSSKKANNTPDWENANRKILMHKLHKQQSAWYSTIYLPLPSVLQDMNLWGKCSETPGPKQYS
jgi:hypothetical protein